MANAQERLQEIADRGLQGELSPEKRDKFNEAVRRGIVTLPEDKQSFSAQADGVDTGGFDFSTMEMIKNIPGSAGQYAEDLLTPILHPMDTATSLYTLARGAAEKLIPDKINGVDFGPGTHEKYADAVGKFFKDRYGSIDNLKRTAQEDPVGVLADVSALLTAGGSAASKIGKLGKAGKAAKTVGQAVDPVNLVTKTARYTAGKAVPKAVPRKMFESAAKWRPSINKAQRARMTETALREKLMPTTKGVTKITDALDDLNTGIDSIIDTATAEGKTIPRQALFKNLKALRKDIGGTKLDAPDNLRQIDRVVKTFEEYAKKVGKDELTPRDLQTLKQAAYKQINFDLKQGRASFGRNEARKAIARAAKEKLEELDPNIKAINKRMGDLLEVQPELERSASRVENLNIIGLGTPMNVGAGGVLGDIPGAAVGAGLSIMEMPRVKARGALLLEGARKSRLSDIARRPVPGSAIRGGLVQSGRLQQAYKNNPLIGLRPK